MFDAGIVQANEVLAIQRQQGSVILRSELQDGIIRPRLI
jgi:hypothetical protein